MIENEALISQVSTGVRSITYLLHPPLLDECGLESALRNFVDGYSKRSGIKVDLTVLSGFGRLTNELEIACFRIVQECLVNIHRHSKSSTAAITLGCDVGCIVVEVRDSGIGIAPNKLSGSASVGLTGMRERVRHLSGTLQIKSDTTGTVVTARLPFGYSTTAG